MKTIHNLLAVATTCLFIAVIPFCASQATSKVTKKTTAAKTTTKAKTATTSAKTTATTTAAPTVSNATAASGLKEALAVGVTNAVLTLNKENGYFGNEAVKILLPKEADPMIKNIKMVPGGQSMFNDLIVKINRAAEDAAGDAKPIFVNAITSMSIADATSILFGSSKTGATDYLKQNTYTQLVAAYKPKVEASLNKDLVGTMSTTESWTKLTQAYNKVANSFVGSAAGLTPVNTDLSGYVTEQALNGLFFTVGNEEKKIRENPTARVSSVLQSVFSVLDKK
jgi:guanyl-specific ribonuclease Sa